ncbi:MAG: hypothetical protein FJY74_07565 [Candidatus Eisenbacteria bacterium]|nr:hypothetical protein [Candidatus Eisenbacteria bacterium]
MTRWTRVALGALALAVAVSGCGKSYDLEAVRVRADEMSARILEALYDSSSRGSPSRVAEIMSEYEDLADPALARHVAKLRDREAGPRARKQLDYLFFDIVGTVAYRELALIGDRIADLEAEGVVRVNGEDIAYRDLGVRLFNETDSARRESLYIAQGRFDVKTTNPLRAEMVSLGREELRRYGYTDLDAMEAERRGLDFDDFERQAGEFLSGTRDMYWELSNEAARRVFGVGVAEVSDYDRGRLFRGEEYDRYFPPERMLPLMRRTLAGMGIDLSAIPAISIDDSDRPEKEPRAAAYPVRPGKDVRILMKPLGGVADYETLFHEMGHALHDALATVTEYEFLRLGDYGTTETHAYLLEGLLSEPLFLQTSGLIPDAAVRTRFLRQQLFDDLAGARYYAALFGYERALHRGGLTDEELVAAYRERMETARLVPLAHPDFGYLSSNEDFYGVNYLEAWFLAAQVRAVLRERFGEAWWTRTEAGDFLRELWAYGAELSPVEIARLIGHEGIDPMVYRREIEKGFNEYR